MSEAKQHSKLIKEEASRLLESTNIEHLLGQFGDVSLGGSYAYDLMVDRDLDFGVLVKSVTPGIRAKIASFFTSQLWVYSFNLVDRVNFEPLSNLGAPMGLYLGLTIPFPKERWNIDVWFIVAEGLPDDEISKAMGRATQKQKDTILEIKYELMKCGQKQKGITSSQVYNAVLKRGVRSTQEFIGL